MLAALGLAHALPSTSLAKHRVVPRRAVSPVCALAFDLEQCDLVLSSSTSAFRARVLGGDSLAAVRVSLLEAKTRRPVEIVEGALSAAGDLDLRIPLSVSNLPGSDYLLHAASGSEACTARVVHSDKMALLEMLEGELLFSGARSGSDTYPLALALVRASLEQKLRTAGGDAASMDSASTDFSRLLVRLRAAAGFSDAQPWHDADECVPWATGMRALTSTISDELSSALKRDAMAADAVEANPSSWESASYEAVAPTWKVMHLWQHGEWLPSAIESFPRSVAALRALDEQYGLGLNSMQNVACGIARQPAGSGIAAHCDGNVLGLTCHLGLHVPDHKGCWIEVGGERQHWRKGELLMMDTTFSHRTRNDSPTDRYVLMLNVLRPGVCANEAAAMKRHLDAPALALDRVNPFYVWSTSQSQALRRGSRHPSDGDVFVAASRAMEGRGVEVSPGNWLPLASEQGGAEEGLRLVVPLSGQTFRVLNETLESRMLPAHHAAPPVATPSSSFSHPLTAGELITPHMGLVDSEGYITWLGFWCGEAATLLAHDASTQAATPLDELDVPEEVLRAHLRVLREPLQQNAVWLPMNGVGGEQLVREVSPEAEAEAAAAAAADVDATTRRESERAAQGGKKMAGRGRVPRQLSSKRRKKAKAKGKPPSAGFG